MKAVRRIQSELKLFQRTKELDNIKLFPSCDDLFKWYFILYNLPNYENGEYLGLIEIPHEYPFKQPTLRLLTPNGIFKIWEAICIHLTDPRTNEHWSPRWNLQTLVLALLGHILDQKELSPEIKQLALQSKHYNSLHYAHLLSEKN